MEDIVFGDWIRSEYIRVQRWLEEQRPRVAAERQRLEQRIERIEQRLKKLYADNPMLTESLCQDKLAELRQTFPTKGKTKLPDKVLRVGIDELKRRFNRDAKPAISPQVRERMDALQKELEQCHRQLAKISDLVPRAEEVLKSAQTALLCLTDTPIADLDEEMFDDSDLLKVYLRLEAIGRPHDRAR